MRKGILFLLRARPASVLLDAGSNRQLDETTLQKAREVFAIPPFPHKQVLHNWRFFLKAGKAATGPPVGQEFSKLGLKAMDFAKSFNDRTKPLFKDDIELIVRIQVYFDKSYQYRVEPPPTAWFILRAIRKKRGDSGPAPLRGAYCALMTLEMCYEIAKMKMIRNFDALEAEQLIETRVRRVIGQARRMGVAIIGIDTITDSPRGLVDGEEAPRTKKQKNDREAAYAQQCERYRELHMQQHQDQLRKQLENAPLVERLHRPSLAPLSVECIEEGLKDANLLNAFWRATAKTFHSRQRHSGRSGSSTSLSSVDSREMAQRYLLSRGWLKDMSADEVRALFGASDTTRGAVSSSSVGVAEAPGMARD